MNFFSRRYKEPETTIADNNQRGPWTLVRAAGAHGEKGKRKSMEDFHVLIDQLAPNCSFFAVYDGHGGKHAARFASKHLHEVRPRGAVVAWSFFFSPFFFSYFSGRHRFSRPLPPPVLTAHLPRALRLEFSPTFT